MSESAELYERDFYAWTQDQAAALRALPPEGPRSNALDVGHLAEEVEGLGASERRAAANPMRRILIHLLKLRFHPDQMARSHWRREVREFPAQLEDVFRISPSLRARREEIAASVWDRAARQVCRDPEDDGRAEPAAAAARVFTAAPPYLDREVLDEDWFPTRP